MSVTLLLTIDLDPDQENRPETEGLALLCRRLGEKPAGFHAVLNVTGHALLRFVRRYPREFETLANWVAEGIVEIGNHSLSHRDFTGDYLGTPPLNVEEQRTEIEQCTRIVDGLFGVLPRVFRAPYFNLTDETLSVLAELGFQYDLSPYATSEIAREHILKTVAIGERKITRITTTHKLDPSSWKEPIPVLQPDQVTVTATAVIILHPWELTPTHPHSNQVWRTLDALCKVGLRSLDDFLSMIQQ